MKLTLDFGRLETEKPIDFCHGPYWYCSTLYIVANDLLTRYVCIFCILLLLFYAFIVLLCYLLIPPRYRACLFMEISHFLIEMYIYVPLRQKRHILLRPVGAILTYGITNWFTMEYNNNINYLY